MKKLKITLMLSSTLFVLGTNSFAATTDTATTEATSYTKYIAMGVAAVIIILLLFLGYKMDSKGDDFEVKKTRKKAKKEAPVEDVKYEPDTVKYENDVNVESSDLSETTEYQEDGEIEEGADFSYSDENDFSDLEIPESPETSEVEPEEMGEEFDTSIIDNIEDEDDITIPEKSDETMVFDKPLVNNIENELDNLEPEEKVEDADPLMKELNNIDTTATSFEGFSSKTETKETKKSTSKKSKEKEETKEETTEKPKKKYTKVVKSSSTTKDFLEQMEENLIKDKEARDKKSK